MSLVCWLFLSAAFLYFQFQFWNHNFFPLNLKKELWFNALYIEGRAAICSWHVCVASRARSPDWRLKAIMIRAWMQPKRTVAGPCCLILAANLTFWNRFSIFTCVCESLIQLRLVQKSNLHLCIARQNSYKCTFTYSQVYYQDSPEFLRFSFTMWFSSDVAAAL